MAFRFVLLQRCLIINIKSKINILLYRGLYIIYYYNKKNKYSNKKVTIDGITFDSKKEANRYCELKLLQRAGKIKNLQMQVKYVVIPSQYEFYERYGKKDKSLRMVKGFLNRNVFT